MASLPEYLSKAPIGRGQVPRQVIEAHQRDRILDAALGVFARRGYPATTIDHIVAAARIGVGSFYALFDGKDDCFIQLFDRVAARGRERIVAAIPADADWAEQALSALRAALELIADEPHAGRIVLIEVQTAGPLALSRYGELLEGLAPLLRRGRELSPVGAELPQTFEDATIAGVAWLLHQRLVAGELKDIEKLLPELAGILIEPYIGESRALTLLS